MGLFPIPPPPGSKNHSLPHNYAFVPAVALTTTRVSVPKLDTRMSPGESNDSLAGSVTSSCLDEAKAKENSWVKHALTLVEKEELDGEDALAWAAYHALQQTPAEDPPALCALL